MMTKEEIMVIKKIAFDWCLDNLSHKVYTMTEFYTEEYCKFAELIAEKEREECAKVCETAKEKIWEYHEENVKNASFNVCINIAKLIRARGQE